MGGLSDVSWFGVDGGTPDWDGDVRSLVCLLAAQPNQNGLNHKSRGCTGPGTVIPGTVLRTPAATTSC